MRSQAELNRQALAAGQSAHDLGRRTARGGLIAVAAQPIKIGVQLVSGAVLARLLAPDDFGLVAMASVVMILVGVFSDLGLGVATTQRKDIDQDTVSALFFISLGVGCLLMPVVWGAAPLAAWFFGDARVAHVLLALSLTLPLQGATAQHNALMTRSMRWVALQWTGLCSQIVGAMVGILAASVLKLGYWSLVASAWATQAAAVALVWQACRWRPTLVKTGGGCGATSTSA